MTIGAVSERCTLTSHNAYYMGRLGCVFLEGTFEAITTVPAPMIYVYNANIRRIQSTITCIDVDELSSVPMIVENIDNNFYLKASVIKGHRYAFNGVISVSIK